MRAVLRWSSTNESGKHWPGGDPDEGGEPRRLIGDTIYNYNTVEVIYLCKCKWKMISSILTIKIIIRLYFIFDLDMVSCWVIPQALETLQYSII